jgi:hypothetical protein
VAHELNYSPLDRLLHRVAFAAPFIQLTAADIEGVIYGSQYEDVHAARPIFVTSLPRAGTTVLLEALSQLPSLASHVYRDMPFVLAPVLWSRLSGPFRQNQAPRERAHGDGIEIGFDSPEAFEEIIWRAFWPSKYTSRSIALWQTRDASREARRFFVDHMKKIVALRRPKRPVDGRYLSKNNANIARLQVIERMFPDATVVVPVRRPLEHAASMLRQHRNFLEMQRTEPFVRRYMIDVGHYEFGDVHRPLAFEGLRELTEGRSTLELEYWLGYWIAAFEHILARRSRLVLVSHEHLCATASTGLAALCDRLSVDPEDALPKAAEAFKERSGSTASNDVVDQRLRHRAETIYDQLMRDRIW